MWDSFRAVIDVLAEGLRQFSAKIIAAVLFALCMWKFPSLRSFLDKYRRRSEPEDGKEAILKKLEEVQEELNDLKRRRTTQAVDKASEYKAALEASSESAGGKQQEGELSLWIALISGIALVLGIWHFEGDVTALIYGVTVIVLEVFVFWLLEKGATKETGYQHIEETIWGAKLVLFWGGTICGTLALIAYYVMKSLS